MIDAPTIALLSLSIPLLVGIFSYPLAKSTKYGHISRWLCLSAALFVLIGTLGLIPTALLSPIQIELASLPLLSVSLEMGMYIDLLSLSFAFLIALFAVLVLSYGISYFAATEDAVERSIADRTMSFSLILVGGLLGTLFSRDLFMLLVFWEITSFSLYALILNERSSDQAFKAFLMTHAGGLGLFALTIVTSTTLGTVQIQEIASNPGVLAAMLPILVPLTVLAVLPKGIQFPFHTWFSDATAAPSSTMVLILVSDLAGIYLLLRLLLQAFEPAFALIPVAPLVQLFGNINEAGLIISLIGSVTLVVGAIHALREDDLLQLVAYSAASELGFVFIVLGLGFPLGITASLFYAISHTMVVGLLFFCAGVVVLRTKERRIDSLGGLYHSMPITASCAAISVLAIGGLPLLSEFVAKYLVVISAITIGSPFFLFVAILGELLHIVIATRFLYSVFLVRSKVPIEGDMTDPPRPMLIPMLLLTAMIVIIGINPALLLNNLVFPSVIQLGFSLEEVIPFLVLSIYGGISSPVIITAASLVLLSVFVIAVNYSLNKGKYRHEPHEEAFKPFICGEDGNQYTPLYSDLFYTIRTEFFRLDEVARRTDVDRFFNAVAERVYRACTALLRIDIRYQFARAFVWFISGVLAVLLIAFLLV